MAKFLVLARPRKPMPERANVEGARAQWRELRDIGKAEVYEIIEDNGEQSRLLNNVHLLFSVYGPEVVIDSLQSDVDSLQKLPRL